MAHGFTLLEALVALLLATIVMSTMTTAGRTMGDRMAVLGARESVVGLFDRARGEALGGGGATLTISARPPLARLDVADSLVTLLDLGSRFGVELEIVGGRAEVAMAFDRLGIPRMASATLDLRRGSYSAGLTVASYGRVTRR